MGWQGGPSRIWPALLIPYSITEQLWGVWCELDLSLKSLKSESWISLPRLSFLAPIWEFHAWKHPPKPDQVCSS